MTITEIPTKESANNADNMLNNFEYYDLYHQSESVRWKFSDIDWDNIDTDAVEKEVDHVTHFMNGEFTTFPAAINFFREFSNDMDYTQWVTIWLYEETRHAHALMKWLSHFGVKFDESQMADRRNVYPEGPSRIGTLSTNIISETRAASWYYGLSQSTKEPVLQDICKKLSADESRHAVGFLTYAKKTISNSEQPDLERLRALEMLYGWLNRPSEVEHPAGHFFPHTDNRDEIEESATIISDAETVNSRICRMFGNLVGVPLQTPADIKPQMRHFLKETQIAGSI